MGAALVRSAFSLEHQGAARLLDRALRRTRADDRPGRAHPGPSRRDARGGRRSPSSAIPRRARCSPSTIRSPAGRTFPTSRSSRVPQVGFAVSRAHHADVGGMEPSSLPAELARALPGGRRHPAVRLDDDVLRARSLANMRNPDERRGDLRAQIAAQRLAEHRVAELCERAWARDGRGGDGRALAYSERHVRAGIARASGRSLRGGRRARAARGDSRDPRLRSRSTGDEIEIDFAGTSPQHDGNLNCPLAVTRSACFYVVRCLTAPDIPASGGAYAPVTVRAPDGSLVNAQAPGGGRRGEHGDVEPDHRRRCSAPSGRLSPCRRRARGR